MSDINNINASSQPGLNGIRKADLADSQSSKSPANTNKTDANTDTVSLTNTATQLQSLQQSLADSPSVNSERVSALRAAIDDGSYQVDPKELAQNMTEFEINLR